MHIRLAVSSDLPQILDIYNDAILHTVATFDTVPRTLEQQEQWFEQHGAAYPVLVAEQDGAVVGWASANRYSDRLAYARTAELSLYVREGQRGQGIGKALFERLLAESKAAGLHTVLSRIVEGNDNSIHIHHVYGFDTVGTMREVGFKFGRLLNVVLLQKIL
ncbi:L-methionine sulfoximine/L-methionine sulfone acetyltransferase [Paenibacillus solanacearum]|uniref:L-methionine sulfoximine/L-methionine sulfone acetyltransferase n=1 Tax=Paenibacillus solanacearum TaxID=2048548 RepID=A0A916K1E1_9BACL|nr:GNAT family N-acetyltransferase [Paenibacillus solanacearum]CAG7624507.1 L-methionine sulfoximine/L-methionine sulfone acetyltransferase [Paenibacillus solanacearum]